MPSTTAITVEGLGKQYTIRGPREAYGSLRDSLSRAATQHLRNVRHLLRAGKPRETATDSVLWALRDVSFEVQVGEVVGIIGRNGAGKSTLLKILSRVTEPTTGRAEIRGRLGSLLEVGTGFHPELTGRENIYLNGAILGMSRADIRQRFDEIVAFAEIEKFIDTPAKRYSSGMYLRLAFAVAAHLDPDILVLDEVLAVGDAAFQRKCISRMESVASEGRTVLLVSHNLHVVRALCSTSILLDGGCIVDIGKTGSILQRYNNLSRTPQNLADAGLQDRLGRTTGSVRFTSVKAIDDDGNEQWEYATGDTLRLQIQYDILGPIPSLGLYLALGSGSTSEFISTVKHVISDQPGSPMKQRVITLELPSIALRPGDFFLYIVLGDKDVQRGFDVVDRSSGLPWIHITSQDLDPHRTAGYFSMPSRVISDLQ